MTAALSFGITIHNTLHKFLQEVQRSQESLFHDLESFPSLEHLEQLYFDHWVSQGYEDYEHMESRREQGQVVLRKWYERIRVQQPVIFDLERPFKLSMEGFGISGRIDRIDKQGHTLVIIDYKTGRLHLSHELIDKLQLIIYDNALEQSYPHYERKHFYTYLEHDHDVEITIGEKERTTGKALIQKIAAGIQHEEYAATPSTACNHCPFKMICPDAVQRL